MIQAKKTLPEIYSQSFDMSIFTGLLDLLYGARELDQMRARVCHSALNCFEEDLPRLASLFNLPVTSPRQLLDNYRLLVKRKGTALAIKSSVTFSTGLELTEGAVDIERDGNKFTAYADFTKLSAALLETLLHRLAPVGAFIQLRPLSEKPPVSS